MRGVLEYVVLVLVMESDPQKLQQHLHPVEIGPESSLPSCSRRSVAQLQLVAVSLEWLLRLESLAQA